MFRAEVFCVCAKVSKKLLISNKNCFIFLHTRYNCIKQLTRLEPKHEFSYLGVVNEETGIREQKIITPTAAAEMSVSTLSEDISGISGITLHKQLLRTCLRAGGSSHIRRRYVSANRFPDETFDSKLHKVF